MSNLVASFTQRVVDRDLVGYRNGAVPRGQIQLDAVSIFRQLLEYLDHPRATASSIVPVAHRLGVNRARDGIPLSDLISAIKLDFEVLWSYFCMRAEDGDAPVLLAAVSRIWGAVDRFSSEVQRGYIEESARISDRQSSERATIITRILTRERVTSEDEAVISDVLGIGPRSVVRVVAASTRDDRALRMCVSRLTEGVDPADGGTVIHSTGSVSLLIAHGIMATDYPRLSSVLADLHCGITPPITGSRNIPRACSLAVRILNSRTDDQATIVQFGDCYPTFFAEGLLADGPELGAEILAKVDELSLKEQERLTDILIQYARSGSVGETAERLFFHRNTVLNYFKKVERLAGLNPSVPLDCVLLIIALRMRQLGVDRRIPGPAAQ